MTAGIIHPLTFRRNGREVYFAQQLPQFVYRSVTENEQWSIGEVLLFGICGMHRKMCEQKKALIFSRND